ncbi:MAG: RNA polymerase sigma-54 factor, partial [Bacteroidales bacterium]|nr:RNA polymerase sigma-54 factor [Bacteroidales bacterium]
MASSNGNILTQELQQIQTLSPQQVLQVRLLEMSVQELEQRIHKELLDNEALEKGEEESEALPTTEEENAE